MGSRKFRMPLRTMQLAFAAPLRALAPAHFNGRLDSIRGEGLFLVGGAKAYWLGGGWWSVGWYAQDRSDLDQVKLAWL